MKSIDDTKYWNSYYAKDEKKIRIPSQFSTFVLSETYGDTAIVDVGCGNGRDAMFFSGYFQQVFGIDSSKQAIEKCAERAQIDKIDNIEFYSCSVDTDDFLEIVSKIRDSVDGSIVIYSRFFLHALSDESETLFFDSVAKALNTGDKLALEYRTVRDASGKKYTAEHYRRFVSPPSVYAKLDERNFTLSYAVEGFGMAKYEIDDAYVARSLHVKK